MCTMFGAIIAVVCSYKGMTASGGAAGVGRAVNQAVVIALVAVFFFQFVFTSVLLATNPELQSRSGDRLARRPARLARLLRRDRPLRLARRRPRLLSGRVLRFFGESLRQAGILILGSALIIWAFVFILGLQCGLQGAYFNRSIGAPSLAGLFSAYCDLREGLPYAFGYILSAKVGTGIVAEIGAMRISDEIDALEVMGIQPVTFLCATRLLGAWIAIPFLYLVGIGVDLLRQLPLGGPAGRRRLLRRLPADLLDVPEPARPDLQPDQGDGDGDRDRAGRLLLRLHRLRRPGRASAPRPRKSMVVNIVARPHHRHARHRGLLGLEPPRPDRRLKQPADGPIRQDCLDLSARRRRVAAVVAAEGEVDEAAGAVVVLVRLEEQVLGVDGHHEGEAAAQAADVDPLLE